MFLSTIIAAMTIGTGIGGAVAAIADDDNSVGTAVGTCIGAVVGALIAAAEAEDQYGDC